MDFGGARAGDCFFSLLASGLFAFSPFLGANRHTYLLHLCLLLAGAALLAPPRGAMRAGLAKGYLAFILSSVTLSANRLHDWRNDFALFGAEMRLNPRSKIAPLHLGAAWMLAGRPDLALPLFERSLAIDPAFDLAKRNAARARAALQEGSEFGSPAGSPRPFP